MRAWIISVRASSPLSLYCKHLKRKQWSPWEADGNAETMSERKWRATRSKDHACAKTVTSMYEEEEHWLRQARPCSTAKIYVLCHETTMAWSRSCCSNIMLTQHNANEAQCLHSSLNDRWSRWTVYCGFSLTEFLQSQRVLGCQHCDGGAHSHLTIFKLYSKQSTLKLHGKKPKWTFLNTLQLSYRKLCIKLTIQMSVNLSLREIYNYHATTVALPCLC